MTETTEFFYILHTPHTWSSGPKTFTLDPETFEPIESLERAREVAQTKAKGKRGDWDHVDVSWGVRTVYRNG